VQSGVREQHRFGLWVVIGDREVHHLGRCQRTHLGCGDYAATGQAQDLDAPSAKELHKADCHVLRVGCRDGDLSYAQSPSSVHEGERGARGRHAEDASQDVHLLLRTLPSKNKAPACARPDRSVDLEAM
jgi:hypothetical protein